MTEPEKIRVLSLEDSTTDVELQQQELKSYGIAFDWKTVDNERNFQDGVADFHPHVILVDYKLPAYDGNSALKYVQSNYPHIPVIIVTGTVGELKAVQLIKGGAFDYILKDRLARLPDTITNAVKNARLAAERIESEIKLAESEQKLKNSLLDFVGSLATVVGLRDPYTAGHQRRVAELAVVLARSRFQLKFSTSQDG
jgi:DNA-binding NtrC family response regulator